MNKQVKSRLDKIVKELQLDIVSSFNNSGKIKESERTAVGVYIQAISKINKYFGTNYKTATLCYNMKEKLFDENFKKKFPEENVKGYVDATKLLKNYNPEFGTFKDMLKDLFGFKN
ncbi:Uncharacterised protein [uncultured archaeon]|nr:Uncharacterised protein [uncultured archaeon]